jgi:hypothetical protein
MRTGNVLLLIVLAGLVLFGGFIADSAQKQRIRNLNSRLAQHLDTVVGAEGLPLGPESESDPVPTLLRQGASIHTRGKEWGATVPIYAAWTCRPRLLQRALDGGVDVNARSASGSTALTYAVAKGCNLTLVKLLLERGATITPGSGNDDQVVFHAVDKGDVEVARLLLEHGALPGPESEKAALLVAAVESRRAGMVALLLDHGISPSSKHGGKTVLQVARRLGDRRIVRLLEQASAEK